MGDEAGGAAAGALGGDDNRLDCTELAEGYDTHETGERDEEEDAG